MRQVLTIIAFLAGLQVFGQTDSISNKELEKNLQPIKLSIQKLQNENVNLKIEVFTLQKALLKYEYSVDSLKKLIEANQRTIQQTANDLGAKISSAETNTHQKITEVDNLLSKNSLYGIIGVLLAVMFSGLFYYLLRKRQNTDKTEVVEKLNKTKSSIEESLVKEFEKQTDLIENQLQLMAQREAETTMNSNAEPDHSLALKVASEINLIERNINLMDSKTRGLKQLQASVGKLKDNLAANGYEMPLLLGKTFNQGMRVIVATSIPDENLEKGQEIITKILIPQVNFNDKMIQTAQIEVSVGY